MDGSEKKALIAMSGGVDSSVAAYLMKEQGYTCVGATMQLFSPKKDGAQEEACGSAGAAEDARAVADRLGMPFYMFDYSGEFEDGVIRPFAAQYPQGITPNPCIECNRCMKFGRLFAEAKRLGCDVVVTGHYVRVRKGKDGYELLKGKDPGKDQSYVLYHLTQEQLAHVHFPLGEYDKDHIRRIAREQGFTNAGKPDSQDICFVPDGDYARVIREHSAYIPPAGDFVDARGNVLGTHRGIIHYTIGQRKGLGLAFGEPRFVCEIRPDTNEVVLGPSEELFHRALETEDFHWILNVAPQAPIRAAAKIRYRHREQPCVIIPLEDGRVRAVFDEPVRAITPGQSLVVYDGEVVLGGGIIRSSCPTCGM